jgi:hypothetical protein
MNSDRVSTRTIPASADYDTDYTLNQPPATYLPLRTIVRLTILRSRLGDVGDHRAALVGRA